MLYGGARMSAQRRLIAEVVTGMPGAFTAEELHHRVAERSPGIGLATVYRALGAMQSAGTLSPVGHRNGSTLLALCERHDHHHHLVCTQCASVIGVECPLGEAALSAAAEGGHLVTSHEIILYGLCASCRTKNGSR